MIVINLGEGTAAGHVRFPLDELRDERYLLVDDTHGVRFERSGRDLVDGLYVALDPGDWHLWRVEAVTPPASTTGGRS